MEAFGQNVILNGVVKHPENDEPMSIELTPVTAQQFAGKSWQRAADLAFATDRHMEVVVLAELAKATTGLPLAFSDSPDGPALMGVMGLRPGVNLLIAPNRQWMGPYLPAALRSHPFHLAKPAGAADPILCFDTGSGLLREAGQGEAFFDADGKMSSAVLEVVKFLSQVEQSRRRTMEAAADLAKAGLLVPWPINWELEGKRIQVQGLKRVDEAALLALAENDFLGLRQNAALTVAYAQMFSMNLMPALVVQAQKSLKAPGGGLDVSRLQGMGISTEDGLFKFD